MADAEQIAMQLMAQAEKKLTSSKGCFIYLFGGSSNSEEAKDLYERAANKFKMANKWESAGHAFTKLASLHKTGSQYDAATYFVEAGKCFKRTDPNESIKSLLNAIEIYTDMGRFKQAARHHQSIAEIFETQVADMEKAIQHYEQASDYYSGEDDNSSAKKCLLKVAMFAAQMENYEKAIQIYEKVAASSLQCSLLRYSAKEYMFRAALCHLCVDLTNSKIAVEKYEKMSPGFQDSREHRLLKTLMKHLEDQNVDAFTNAVTEYDSISRLDQWHTTMLLRIKKSINDEDLC